MCFHVITFQTINYSHQTLGEDSYGQVMCLNMADLDLYIKIMEEVNRLVSALPKLDVMREFINRLGRQAIKTLVKFFAEHFLLL